MINAARYSTWSPVISVAWSDCDVTRVCRVKCAAGRPTSALTSAVCEVAYPLLRQTYRNREGFKTVAFEISLTAFCSKWVGNGVAGTAYTLLKRDHTNEFSDRILDVMLTRETNLKELAYWSIQLKPNLKPVTWCFTPCQLLQLYQGEESQTNRRQSCQDPSQKCRTWRR